jgi:hypothetical protein
VRDAWLLEGGVKGRNPPPFADPVLLEPIFSEPMVRDPTLEDPTLFRSEAEPALVRSEFPYPDERLLLFKVLFEVLFGALKERDPALRLDSPSRPATVPALGFCIEPDAAAPRNPADVPALVRPPAVTAPTWFAAIDCRRLAVCCWNEAGRATLLCDPKKLCEPPLRIVEGAAARPLADKLALDGTTGRLPAIMRAPLNCARVAPMAVTRPAPK